MMKKILAIVCIHFFSINCVLAQDFSNKGKEFWVGYGLHCRMYSNTIGGTQEMVLYFATEVATTVKVEIPSLGYSQSYSIAANSIFTTAPLPKIGAMDARILTEGVNTKGIHITSDKPIVAYAHIYNGSISGATVLFPTATLGREYYSMNYTQNSNEANSNTFFYAIAVDTGTTIIEVIPSANTLTMTAGKTYSFILKQGEVFNALGVETSLAGGLFGGSDLTGSIIRSVSTNGNCKKIAVFSGAGKLFIRCAANQNNSADNYMVQAFPKNAWGKYFLTVPTKTMPNNFFRIGVQDPSTVVKLNGTVLSGLINNFYYQIGTLNTPSLIESNKPIMVAQYVTTQGSCGNGTPGDPEVIYLSPVEQNINKVILNSTPNSAINGHYLNVVIPNTGTSISSFKVDGASPPTGSFVTHPGNSTYSYMQYTTTAGQHIIQSDSGFNAIAYGFGPTESYGYNAGTNVIDLYQYVSTSNQYATINFPAACKNSPFILSLTLPYIPLSMKWNIPGHPAVVNNAPTADSTFTKNGKQLYLFKLPLPYVYTSAGIYPIVVTVNNPTADGCSGEQVISFDLQVYDPPVADFTWPVSLCTDSLLQLTTNNNTVGRPIIKHYWDYGDGTFDNINNPVKKYTAPGAYTIRYSVLTDAGCISDTISKVISLTKTPIARFGFTTPLCKDKQITFIDSSTLEGGVGSITNWNWNLGNGTSITNTTNANVGTTYPKAQVYNPTLQVVSNTGCASEVYTLPITINPNPVSDFTMSNACLPTAFVNFTNTSTIASGSSSSLSSYWDFGDPATGILNNSAISNPVHSYGTTGPYNIKLLVTSNNGCVDSIIKPLTTIFAQPKAGFTSPTEACWKSPMKFTDASNGVSHPITGWEWQFINSLGIVVASSSIKDPTYTFTVPGSYTVKHWIITSQNCISDTAISTVIIHPWPTPNFTTSSPLCEKNNITLVDNSTANAGTLVKWYWNLGDGTISNTTNNSPINHTYTSWGDKAIRLVIENSNGCISDTLFKTVHINPLPKIGYILPEVCLSDANAVFIDSSHIADMSESQMTYSWNFNASTSPITPAPVPATSTGKNPVTHFNKAYNYLLSLVVTSKDGCKDSATQIPFTVNGSIPKADFVLLPTNGGCSNHDVQIKDNSNVDFGTITKVEIYWDFANTPTSFDTDNTPSQGKMYSHKYPNFQSPITYTYQVRYRAYSGIVCVNDVIKPITVQASPKTVFTTIPGICLDATPRQVTQALEIGGLPGTGIFSGTGINATGLFNPAITGIGLHTLTYTFTTPAGCTDSSSQTIEVWPRPIAAFSPISPACEKNIVQVADNSIANSTAITTWNWNFGDGTPVSSLTGKSPVTHSFTAFGTYNVSLQVINDRGCTSISQTVPVIINPLPKANFSLPKVCLPAGLANFTDLSTIVDNTQGQFLYTWNFGDVYASPPGTDVSTLKNPIYKYSRIGTYNVTLIVTSSNGCKDSITRQLVDIFPQPKASFTSVDSICIGQSIQFTDNSNGSGSPVQQWKWFFGNGATSVQQNPLYLYPSPGFYTVQHFIFTNEGCVSDTATKLLNVWSYPVVNAGPDLFVLEDGIKKITDATATGTGLQYTWTPSTYLDNTTLLNPTITLPKDDIAYKLTVIGRGGCTSSDNVIVKVLKMPKPPNTFTPNGDGINDLWEIPRLGDYPGCIVEVYNTAGTLLFRSIGYTTPWNGTWNGKPLPAGTYYYVIDPKNGRSRSAGYVTILR